MAIKSTMRQNKRFPSAFTLIELIIVVVVIALLAGLVSFAAISVQRSSRDTARNASVKVISTALEKYYRKNGEYPSVAFMASQDVATIKQKLGIVNANILKLPMADDATKNSIVTSNPSTTRLLYLANTSDSTKNTQCQTDVNGYCDGFTLQYKKEADGTMVSLASLHDTFTPVAGTSSCAAGETQSGNTCTKTYAATYQSGSYTCPSGGTLSGTTCTQTYSASYSSGSYYCNSGDSLSGTTCTHTTTSTYAATYGCPPAYDPYGYGGSVSDNGNGTCHMTYTSTVLNGCNSGWTNAGTSEQTQYCAKDTSKVYSCPSGGTLSGSTCTTSSTSTYSAYYSSGGYYCPSGGTLSGTTCTKTYTATQSSGYYTCPSGGTLSGTTCTYSYTLP